MMVIVVKPKSIDNLGLICEFVEMARPLRIEFPSAWYHFTCRGNERNRILKDDTD